jgi:hypothetical protein
MRDNLEHRAAELAPQDQEENDLSRRSFLARLTILGVGCAAAMTLGVGKADATTDEIDTATKAKGLADDEALTEDKKAEAVDDVDQDDELEFSAQTRGMTRRRVRRTRRRVRRRYRRTRRRVRRATRRVRRRVRRGVELIVNWAVGA